MERENRLRFVLSILLWLLLGLLPCNIYALGEYDGVWVGTENINIPGYTYVSETTGTIFYQQSSTSLSFWDPIFGAIDLVPAGNQWILPSPLSTIFNGEPVLITQVSITFQTDDYLTGDITVEMYGVTATATLSHTKQLCQTLVSGVAQSGLAGGVDTVRCYEIDLPSGATNLDIQTWAGTGDCDLIQIYHRPPFENYLSENLDSNSERITVSSPSSGKWFVGVLGSSSYSGVNLVGSYAVPPPPVSNFTATPLAGEGPLAVRFTDQSTGVITTWDWDFGDGSTSTAQNPVHVFSGKGTYTVSLTVAGPWGTATETKLDYIEVQKVMQAMPWIPLLLLDGSE